MYQNIPQELRVLRQWVCWRAEESNGRQTKIPYCPTPHTMRKASVLNPATWGTFEEAVRQASGPAMSGIGFVLTEEDPYTGIDIDDKQEDPASEEQLRAHGRILEAFQSYTERSVGERWTDEQGRERGGYHIIIRGKIAGGRDRGHVGVYSTARYLTFTGEVVRNAPIADYQELLLDLVREMPASEYHGELDEVEGYLTDEELHEMALGAANGDKYRKLIEGDWKAMGYPSQSEADLALLSIYAFYTRDNAQVRRMFRYTKLGKRGKAINNDVYLNRTLRMIRSKQPNEAQLDAARDLAANMVAEGAQEVETAQEAARDAVSAPPAPARHPEAPAHAGERVRAQGSAGGFPVLTGARAAFNPPPGLVGELARYIYATSVRPLPEASITAAIGLVAGVAGRAYNISGTGLNQYILFLGGTGTGKEGIVKGINKVLAATRPRVSMVDEFIGPSTFASGQGLVRVLDTKPCFVSLMGEFGLTLQSLSDPRAPAAAAILRKVLLDLYSKSGWDDVLSSTAYSDVEKNTRVVKAPSVTLLAESTPETFYEGINLSDISDGLIPRFHVVEYTGKRGPRNRSAGAPPHESLVSRFADLCSSALTAQNNNSCSYVLLDPAAQALLDEFDVQCDEQINAAGNSADAQLYNRAHLKALKLAGLLAVGVNPHQPVVTQELAEWSIELVRVSSEQVLQRFRKGNVGKGDSKQVQDARRVLEHYFKLDARRMKSYNVKPEIHAEGLATYAYFLNRLSNLNAFANDRMGGKRAVQSTLATMVDTEVLVHLSKDEAYQRFGVRQELYGMGPDW